MADFQGYIQVFLICVLSTILLVFILKRKQKKTLLPPSPLPLPIIGHLHLLSPIPHQDFHNLSIHYGPIIHLFLGSIPCVIANTAEAAKEFLKTHETSFSNRPAQTVAVEALTYGFQDFLFAPYGPYWKFMKKLCMSELLGGHILDQFLSLRQQETKRFIKLVHKKGMAGEAVDFGAELDLSCLSLHSFLKFSSPFASEKVSMGSLEAERTTVGWAARDPSGILSPYTYNLRNTGPDDVYLKVHYCGICHSDLHQIKNDLGMSNYPMVPGHEVVGEVLEVGSNVTKFRVGEIVGAGLLVGCCKNCNACQSDIEQYCSKKIWSYNDVYTDGKPTQGGFAETMIVEQKFVVKIPEGLAPEQVAPLLCAGVTVYSPLSHFGLKQSGLRGGILGLGGVGHMGVKIAKAFGHHVTVISSSDRKKQEALEHLGADAYLVSSDTTSMQEAAESLDYIIDTVPVGHPLEPYLSLLKLDGKLILMGVINTPLQFVSPMVMLGRKSITGSFIGSIKETEEMLEFWKEKGLNSMIEIVTMDYVNKALERLEKNDVRYRFVVDVKGSKLDQ